MLRELGHTVTGLSIDFKENGYFSREFVESSVDFSFLGDIRDKKSLDRSLEAKDPDVVVHLAAQALVINGFENPHETFSTNALGTHTLLEVLSTSVKPINCLIITTDKVYKPTVNQVHFTEDDSLGGTDPYSHSKVVADSIAQFWMSLNTKLSIGIARAGNVVGGGDKGEHRLIPYLAECLILGESPRLRYPHAVRPWQHVLDCVSGYAKLASRLQDKKFQAVWNFGPNSKTIHTVSDVVSAFVSNWGNSVAWDQVLENKYEETPTLLLDSSRAQRELGWHETYDFTTTIRLTSEWYKEVLLNNVEPGEKTMEQVREFIVKAQLNKHF